MEQAPRVCIDGPRTSWTESRKGQSLPPRRARRRARARQRAGAEAHLRLARLVVRDRPDRGRRVASRLHSEPGRARRRPVDRGSSTGVAAMSRSMQQLGVSLSCNIFRAGQARRQMRCIISAMSSLGPAPRYRPRAISQTSFQMTWQRESSAVIITPHDGDSRR
jgi:hypothetical protein